MRARRRLQGGHLPRILIVAALAFAVVALGTWARSVDESIDRLAVHASKSRALHDSLKVEASVRSRLDGSSGAWTT